MPVQNSSGLDETLLSVFNKLNKDLRAYMGGPPVKRPRQEFTKRRGNNFHQGRGRGRWKSGSKFRSQGRPNQTPQPDANGVVTTDELVFKQVGQVGEGTYGKVYKAVNIHTGLVVAMKRLRLEAEREGFPVTAAREIRLLQSMEHPNIVSLREMIVSEGDIYMAFEYIQHDLAGLLQNPSVTWGPAEIKSIMKQTLSALGYLHHKKILHRDVKGSNILVDSRGHVKLADFGLARSTWGDEIRDLTNRVITLWYRPPELLLGATRYGAEVDMWGAGCILGELFLRKPLFHGNSEVSQIVEIQNKMGVPTYEEWPERYALPWFYLAANQRARQSHFREIFSGPNITEHTRDLVESFLKWNPRSRITAQEALSHPFFSEEPLAKNVEPGNEEWHDFEAKKRRREEQAPKEDQKTEKKPETTTSIVPNGPRSTVRP